MCGPVVAGAVFWDPEVEPHPLLNDSKKMTRKNRAIVRDWIHDTHLCGVGVASEKEIDEKNILRATHMAMHRAIRDTGIEPEHLLIDGSSFTPFYGEAGPVPHTCVVKGDSKFASIAAASVLAKEFHDDWVKEVCERHPELHERYGLLDNMAYGSKVHMDGIRQHGPSEYHRLSFAPVKDWVPGRV